MTNDKLDEVKSIVTATYPILANAEYINVAGYEEKHKKVSYTIGVCTLWTTAYTLLKNNNFQRKLYIIQDDERSFYPRGSVQALVDQTYDFGFWGIAGTGALATWYEQRQVEKNTTMTLGSDLEFSTYLQLSSKPKKRNKPQRVLFYARPDAPRNGFEIGVHALNKLASNMKGQVDIVLAGADFDLSQYEGLHPSIRTAGKVAYSDLAEFYASFNAALFLMFSEHPGVFPLEMMASSCAVVINQHHNASWDELYIHEKTCLTAKPTPSALAQQLERLLTDEKLLSTIQKNGRNLAQAQNDLSYATQAKAAIKQMKTGKK